MKCPICSEDVENLEQHKNQEHEAMEYYSTEAAGGVCPICAEDVDDLYSHVKQKHPDNFDPLINYESTESYDNHTPHYKATEQGGVCPLCGADTSDLYKHMQKEHPHNFDPMTDSVEGTSDYEVDVDEYLKTGEPVQKIDDKDESDEADNYPQKTGDTDYDIDEIKDKYEFTGENWDNVSQNNKTVAFEGLGFTQGDALLMAELSWINLSTEVKKALEVQDKEKEDKREEDTSIYNDETESPDTQIEEEDGIDYNIIGENSVAREKYECEWCNSEFKLNESLLTHYNDVHVKASEFSIDVPWNCPFCMKDLGENETMGEHLAYNHGITSNSGLEEPANDQTLTLEEGGAGSGRKPEDMSTKEIGDIADKYGKQFDKDDYKDTLKQFGIGEEGGDGSGRKPEGMTKKKTLKDRGLKPYKMPEKDNEWLEKHTFHKKQGEGGAGSGPQGGTALLPEQIAMKNINPDYDAFSKDEGDPYTSPMVDSESLASETTIDECTVCGRTAQNHSNPNTDYRGMNGDAPPTDHYYTALDDGIESLANEEEWHGDLDEEKKNYGDFAKEEHKFTGDDGQYDLYLADNEKKRKDEANEDGMDDAISDIPLKDRTVSKKEFLKSIGRSEDDEAKANEEVEYTGGDFCAKCGTEFEDRGECKKCNENVLNNLTKPLDEIEEEANEEFKEGDHPRDGGKFTSKGGTSKGKGIKSEWNSLSKTERKDRISGLQAKGGDFYFEDWHTEQDWGGLSKVAQDELIKYSNEVEDKKYDLTDGYPTEHGGSEEDGKYYVDTFNEDESNNEEIWKEITDIAAGDDKKVEELPTNDNQTDQYVDGYKLEGDNLISENLKKKIKGVEVYSPTQIMSTEEFKEEDHPRDGGKFTTKGGGSITKPTMDKKSKDSADKYMSGLTDEQLKSYTDGKKDTNLKDSAKREFEKRKSKSDTDKEPENKFSSMSEKDLVKQIKGGSKDWKDWDRNEKTEDAYAEIERRNREIPRPTGKIGDAIFRDDPDAVSKMENKIKVIEDRQEYWKKITKFPSRDYKNRNQLGDYKWFEAGLVSTQLREAKKKLEGIKAQQERGTALTRKPTYPDGSKRFYYSEEPKSEEVWNEITKIASEADERWECLDCDQKFNDAGKHQDETGHHNITKYRGD